MPVVIDEFEVVPDTTPPPSPAETSRGGQAEAANAPESLDLENLIRAWYERAERVRAH